MPRMHFARLVLICLLFLSCTHTLEAQSPTDDFPSNMLGFLKPGTHLIRYYSANPNDRADSQVRFSILDDEAYQVALDARQLSLDELRKKYAAVDQKVEASLAAYRKLVMEKRAESPGNIQLPVEAKASYNPGSRTYLYSVIHVGEDYVLVESAEANAYRRVYPQHSISSIGWSDGLPSVSSRLAD